MVATSLTQARDALRRGDDHAALGEILEAWRARRDPRIADVADGLTIRLLRAEHVDGVAPQHWSDSGATDQEWDARLARGTPMALLTACAHVRAPTRWSALDAPRTLRRLEKLASLPPDPRFTAILVALLQSGEGSTPLGHLSAFVDATAAVLRDLRDRRFQEALGQLTPEETPWMGRLGSVPDAIREAVASTVELSVSSLSPVEASLLSELEDGVAGRKHVPDPVSVRDLFTAVWEQPDSEEARRRLGDRLRACEDPRGELIELQLKRGVPSRRERDLLAHLGREWLGSILNFIDEGFVFEGGFLAEAATTDGASGRDYATFPPRSPSGLGTQEEWSTVVRLSVWRHGLGGTGGLLRSTRLRALREVADVGFSDLLDLAKGSPLPWESFSTHMPRAAGGNTWGAPDYPKALSTLPWLMPRLARLRVASVGLTNDFFDELIRGLPRLTHLAVPRSALGSLIRLARARSLVRIEQLGPIDIGFDRSSEAVDVRIDKAHAPEAVTWAASEIREAGAAGITAIRIEVPAATFGRLRKAGQSEAVPAEIAFGKRTMELGPLLRVGADLQIPCLLAVARDRPWSPSPWLAG